MPTNATSNPTEDWRQSCQLTLRVTQPKTVMPTNPFVDLSAASTEPSLVFLLSLSFDTDLDLDLDRDGRNRGDFDELSSLFRRLLRLGDLDLLL